MAKRRTLEEVVQQALLSIEGRDSGVSGNGGTLKLPWGSYTWQGVLGMVGLVVVVLAGALAGLLIMVHLGFKQLDAREVERIAIYQQINDRLHAEHKELSEWQETFVYILTLPEAERTKLRLKMPKKLEQMERR